MVVHVVSSLYHVVEPGKVVFVDQVDAWHRRLGLCPQCVFFVLCSHEVSDIRYIGA